MVSLILFRSEKIKWEQCSKGWYMIPKIVGNINNEKIKWVCPICLYPYNNPSLRVVSFVCKEKKL